MKCRIRTPISYLNLLTHLSPCCISLLKVQSIWGSIFQKRKHLSSSPYLRTSNTNGINSTEKKPTSRSLASQNYDYSSYLHEYGSTSSIFTILSEKNRLYPKNGKNALSNFVGGFNIGYCFVSMLSHF